MMIKQFGDGRDWFFARRFGLFVHWGIYSIPAWHEQLQQRAGIDRTTYEKLALQFNPSQFDPDAWIDIAETTGMEYLCFTVKHHDGFCLWDTAETDYNVTKTPYGHDVLAILADACHRRAMPLCLYYSIVDWHHPNYPNQGRSHELPSPEPGDQPDMERYMTFLRAQIQELCTRYGMIHGIWWDQNSTQHHDTSINKLIRKLQPSAVINNRGFDDGDFGTPERDWDPTVDKLRIFEKPIEACQSVGAESWGYREEEDYFSAAFLTQSIARTLAKGGNFLLNVGPSAEGDIPPVAKRLLHDIGQWYQQVKEAYVDAKPASMTVDNSRVLLTRSGTSIYIHLVEEPVCTGVVLDPIDRKPRQATLLNTGIQLTAELREMPSLYSDRKKYLHISGLAVDTLNETPIIKLEFGDLEV